jgi:AraC-like DNA-binding protein
MRNSSRDTTGAIGRRTAVALSIIERSYSDPALRLQFVASAVRITSKHLAYLLKSETGAGFRIHLNRIRMRAAQNLLRTSFRSVKEIADMVCYNSTSSFDRQFRRVHGQSPTSWRRNL